MIDDVAKSSHSAGTYFSGLVLIVLLLDLVIPQSRLFSFPPIKPLTMSQNECIKRHLQSGQSLTAIQALNYFGCLRLAARIADLKEQGMAIETQMIESGGKRYAKYFLHHKAAQFAMDYKRENAGI